jgi:hypothetical protein
VRSVENRRAAKLGFYVIADWIAASVGIGIDEPLANRVANLPRQRIGEYSDRETGCQRSEQNKDAFHG